MTFLFRKMPDLPLPPQDLIDRVDIDSRPTTNDLGRYTQRWLVNWGDTAHKAGQNLRIKFPEFEDWARENIYKNIVDAGINYVNIDTESETGPISTGAHTDKIRDFVLLFPVLQGGDDTRLTFWQEKGQETVRPPATDVQDGNLLQMLDWITLPSDCWTLINTNVLHSVENLYSTRINLQISLRTTPWNIY